MVKRSLLVVGTIAILGMAFVAPVKADNAENSMYFPVNVTPDASTETRLAAFLAAGDAVADDTSSSRNSAAGEAVAGGGNSTAGAAVVDGATGKILAARSADDCGEVNRLFGCLTCRPCPCIYGDVEMLFLQQDPHFQNQPIAVNWRTGDTLLSTSQLTPDVSPALRATFGFHPCGCRAIEFTYFGLFNNGDSAVFGKTDPSTVVTFPVGPVGNVFTNMDRIVANYTSYLNSFEVNLPCCCGCCCENDCGCDDCGCGEASCETAKCSKKRNYLCCRSLEWFAGFRYMELGSNLDIAVQSFRSPFTETGDYSIATTNRLFGAQIGGRMRRTVNRFGFELSGDVGIYDNDATQTQTVTDYPNFPLRNTTVTNNNVAFVGEINLSGILRLSDVWSLKAGYSVIWIEGLALAPDQLDFNFATNASGNQLSHDGGMFLHGANVGLEARW